jgi:hypothetical protein
MTGQAQFGANGGGFKTECVGEGVVLQVCEAKSLTMFGASENKLTPDIATAGANAMGGVAGYRAQGTDDRFTWWRAGANEERAVDFDSNMAAMGLSWGWSWRRAKEPQRAVAAVAAAVAAVAAAAASQAWPCWGCWGA